MSNHPPPANLKGMTPAEIDRFCAETLGQEPGQGLRVAALLYRKRIERITDMTDLNRSFRKGLASHCVISTLPIDRVEAADDGTIKLLYRLADGNHVEGVLIPGPDRLTLCVSTQVGCASGCRFCQTGSGGIVRNLSSAEIVDQIFSASAHTAGKPITNVVLMGTGEPLGNYDAVVSFVRIATDRHGMGFSPRKVTISTCGLAPAIERLAGEDVDVSLAVSLNATTDEVRSSIMPVNRTYPIDRLMQALRTYSRTTGRTVTVEYVLFRNLNDTVEDARRLCSLLEGLPCMVNILLFNPFPGCAFERPDEERALAFRDMLVSNGLVAVVRRSRGKDILAACGQLRASSAPSPPRHAGTQAE